MGADPTGAHTPTEGLAKTFGFLVVRLVEVYLTNDANYNIGPGVKGAGVGEGELGEGLEEGLEGGIVKGGWKG